MKKSIIEKVQQDLDNNALQNAIENVQTATVSPPTEDQLQLMLNDTTDDEQKIQIMEKLLAHKRAKVDKTIVELFHAYDAYSVQMTDLFKFIHKIQ